ncbi:MAG: elongation factor G, partial [Candidatus Neomarinimicrobiota bacterium]
MKEYQTEEIRNVVVLGHASSGKTSLCEAMLYTAGATTRLGRIEDGTTLSDYHDDEIQRKFSISSSLLNFEWNKIKTNVLDAPGYLDFIGESKGLTRVADLALIVVHAQSGVEVGTELIFNYAKNDNLPTWFVVNMMDKEHTDFEKAISELRKSFGKKVVPIQMPANLASDFDSVVDILSNKINRYSKDGKGTFTEVEIVGELASDIEAKRNELMESVAESDDALLEKFFENGTLTEDELRIGLKKAIMTCNLFPVLITSAYQNIGVRKMMDLIGSYAPAPNEREPLHGTFKDTEVKRAMNDKELTSLFVFKTINELHVGELSLFKVISGNVKSGVDLLNTTNSKYERIGQIYCLNGKEKLEVGHLHAGDIGTVVKLKYTHTADTLCDPKSPVTFPKIKFQSPVLQVAVEPKTRGDEEKISAGLQSLADEDPTMTFHFDPELKQTILSGQGELHLTIILERLKQKFNVEVNQLPPRIPYRETIKKRGDSKYRHKKQTGGAGQFAEVWMYLEPLESGAGVQFANTLVGQNVDRVFVPSVEKGIRAACEDGILAGYTVTDVKAVFYDGKMHPVDSKDIAFQIAGKGAFKECFMDANPILLEPIFNLEVIVPDEFMGDVMGDISVRRGKI